MNTQKPLPPFKILFLCTGNSARSILAEFLLRKIAPETFETFSAGSHPKPAPHPLTLKVLRERYQLDVSTAHSKSLEELGDQSFDFVITLCGDAHEACPVWPGQPIVAHWPSPDPAGFEGTEEEKERGFWRVAQQIHRRLELLASLSFEKLDALRLEDAVKEIGRSERINLIPRQGPMRLEAFRKALSSYSDRNLAFTLPDGDSVPAHAHITEVGRTQKQFLDCGGKLRQWAFASLQIWVADDLDHRLPASKLLNICEKAGEMLGTDDPEVQVECQEGSIKLFSISEFKVTEELIVFSLANKETACLAMDTCLPASPDEEACCSAEPGCCS